MDKNDTPNTIALVTFKNFLTRHAEGLFSFKFLTDRKVIFAPVDFHQMLIRTSRGERVTREKIQVQDSSCSHA